MPKKALRPCGEKVADRPDEGTRELGTTPHPRVADLLPEGAKGLIAIGLREAAGPSQCLRRSSR